MYNNNIHWRVAFVLWAVAQPRDVTIFPKSNEWSYLIEKIGKTINIYAGPGLVGRREMLTCVQAREPRLHPASEVDHANGTGTRIAESQRSSWSTAEREVVSSQPSSTRVLNTWHSATTWDTEEPEDVSMLLPSWTRQGGWDTRVFGKRARSPRRVEFFFFSMFVSLFVCWHYLERCVTAGNSETEIPEDDLVHFPDACPWHLHRSSQSKRFAAPCEDLFSFFFFLFLD